MAAYVPLRLGLTERKQLHLLEGALSVSQYVDKVDDYPYKSRTGRMVAMVREVCALLCGLLVASDYKLGQATIENKNYADNQRLFQTIFEVGRTKCAQTMENSSSSSRRRADAAAGAAPSARRHGSTITGGVGSRG